MQVLNDLITAAVMGSASLDEKERTEMKRCKHPGCGSYALNLWRNGIDQGDLCDVHYWKNKAETARRDALEDAANKFDGTTAYNPTASDGYANAFDIASELRYMATETPNY